MRKTTIRPTKTRVKGNLLTNWAEIIKNTPLSDYHVVDSSTTDMTWNGEKRQVIRLESAEDNIEMTITTNRTLFNTSDINTENTVTITITITDENQSPITGHHVYIYESDSLLATKTTNSEGIATYTYSTREEGEHYLTIRTKKENGFNPDYEIITLTARTKAYINIKPQLKTITHGANLQIVATMKTVQGYPVVEEELTIYEGARTLYTGLTDENGQVTIDYSESSNRGAPTIIHVDTIDWWLGETSTITGFLVRQEDDIPVANARLWLYKANNEGSIANTYTDNSGAFTLEYTPQELKNNYYIVYGSGILDHENNQYQAYEPTWKSLGKITAQVRGN